MKVLLDSDEFYPVYYLVKSRGVEVDVTEDTATRWKRVEAEMKVVQSEMEAANEAAFDKMFPETRKLKNDSQV